MGCNKLIPVWTRRKNGNSKVRGLNVVYKRWCYWVNGERNTVCGFDMCGSFSHLCVSERKVWGGMYRLVKKEEQKFL